ncbi:hypothetical protein H5410_050637 [Solanum commersonii]|uniref:Uncharacterized protein n=1 Tax=Solanum commersonii TaxID=4109 RepID=A0A9J5WW42_SOLCO|nr:hypothetical protein H5410_050637 [Solanum commersonii]
MDGIGRSTFLPNQHFKVIDLTLHIACPIFDPSERTLILNYHSNHHDVIRRAYLVNGPCQPRLEVHEYPQTNISRSMRRFNHE